MPFIARVWKAGAGGWATQDLSQPKHQTNNRSLQQKWNHIKFKSRGAQVNLEIYSNSPASASQVLRGQL